MRDKSDGDENTRKHGFLIFYIPVNIIILIDNEINCGTFIGTNCFMVNAYSEERI